MQMIDAFSGINVTEQIFLFRNFLVSAWPYLDLMMKNHDWDNDGKFIGEWIQVNWELLVERELLGKNGCLTQFSLTHNSKRILPHESGPIYSVIAKAKDTTEAIYDLRTGSIISNDFPLRICSFRTFKDGAFGVYPPLT